MRSDAAAEAYETFLRDTAVPAFQVFASALAAEGYRFKVFTPAGSVRLASETSPEDFIEAAYDPAADPPTVAGRTSRGRGRRGISSERPLKEGVEIHALTREDVIDFLIAEIPPFVER